MPILQALGNRVSDSQVLGGELEMNVKGFLKIHKEAMGIIIRSSYPGENIVANGTANEIKSYATSALTDEAEVFYFTKTLDFYEVYVSSRYEDYQAMRQAWKEHVLSQKQ